MTFQNLKDIIRAYIVENLPNRLSILQPQLQTIVNGMTSEFYAYSTPKEVQIQFDAVKDQIVYDLNDILGRSTLQSDGSYLYDSNNTYDSKLAGKFELRNILSIQYDSKDITHYRLSRTDLGITNTKTQRYWAFDNKRLHIQNAPAGGEVVIVRIGYVPQFNDDADVVDLEQRDIMHIIDGILGRIEKIYGDPNKAVLYLSNFENGRMRLTSKSNQFSNSLIQYDF